MLNKIQEINKLSDRIKELHGELGLEMPCLHTKLVSIKDISPNGYNPNRVAENELKLLLKSIRTDGLTMPIVCIETDGKYVVVDGYHRYFLMSRSEELLKKNNGYVAVCVIKGTDVIGSTIRHNKARGKHLVERDTFCIQQLAEQGKSIDEISRAIGFEPDRIKKYLGIYNPKYLFADKEYTKKYKTLFEILAELEDKKC